VSQTGQARINKAEADRDTHGPDSAIGQRKDCPQHGPWARAPLPRIRAAALALALLLFAGGIVFSWRHLAPIELILINAALVPVAVAASARQLRLIARLAGVDPGWGKPFRIITLGALSSVLPVSSGNVIRGGAVLYWGATRQGPGGRSPWTSCCGWLPVC
jgi:hypothetical protein